MLLAPSQVENEFLMEAMCSFSVQGRTLATLIIHGVLVANPWTNKTADTELSSLPSCPEQNKCHDITASGNEKYNIGSSTTTKKGKRFEDTCSRLTFGHYVSV